MSEINEFRTECERLRAKYLPDHTIGVRDIDYGFIRGVAVKTPTGQRHAVRSRARGEWVGPPHWWQFWRWFKAWRNGIEYPVYSPPITPQKAIAALTAWVIERDHNLGGAQLEENEEPLS